jgi:2-keto-4-pentenoate hydratase/2-oxohepta-3-ene-1,7-dioic acid hydratase in catechol pathway
MRLLTFRRDGPRRLGVLRPGQGDEVVELPSPTDMLSLIEAGEEGLSMARAALASSSATTHHLSDLDLLPPLIPRSNVVAIGRNYEKHAQETAKQGKEPEPPTIFTKATTSLTGPFADISIDPAISDKLDWEVELAVVIGRAAANVAIAKARHHVFGYTVINDVSARDMQFGWGGQYFKGKSLDRTSPLGPWIVTRDEIDDPQALDLRLRINGEPRQHGNTRDMTYSVDAIIQWSSIGMTLLPGTIIATGTPDGVGFARTPPEFLRPGDVMETEVEGVGLMRNRLVSAVEEHLPAVAIP